MMLLPMTTNKDTAKIKYNHNFLPVIEIQCWCQFVSYGGRPRVKDITLEISDMFVSYSISRKPFKLL